MAPPEKVMKTVDSESDPRIVQSLKSILEKEEGAMALALIGTHVPIKVTPEREVTVSIGLKEELDLESIFSEVDVKKFEKLYLLVHSPGGSVRSSYKVARRIRKTFPKIITFIPHLALSGGTLVALVGNEIVMGEMSNITPLDIQVLYQDQYTSVNAMLRAFDALNNFFSTHSREEAPYPWISMANKLDPVVFQTWIDIAQLTQLYATKILSDENSTFTREEAEKLVTKFTQTYPTHDYALMADDLREIIASACGEKAYVKSPADYPQLWEAMKKWQRKYAWVEANSHIFRYVLPGG